MSQNAVGDEAPEIIVPETETEEEATAGTQTAKQVNAESVLDMQQQLANKIPQLRIKRYKRVTPSDTDQRNLSISQADVADQKDSNSMLQKPDGVPSGMLWGSIIHRAAELIVCDGSFSDESVQESCEQAVKEQIQSELLSKKQRKELDLPMEAFTIEAIQTDLIRKAVSNMKSMNDPDSTFRQMIKGAKLYPEIPFTISARKDQGELYGNHNKYNVLYNSQ